MGDSPSGHIDPRLVSLYPSSDDPRHLRDIASRHARQIELGVITAKDHYRQIRELNSTLAKTNALLEKQIDMSEAKEVDLKVQNASKERATKLQTAGMSLLAAVIGGLLAFAGSYARSESKTPESPQLSAEQRQEIVRQDRAQRAARGDQPVSSEFERSLPKQ